MDDYDISWAGRADEEFNHLLTRADAAGKRAALVWWISEVWRTLRDPKRALQVWRSLGQTALPGGFFRDWQHGCLYVRYAIFPDQQVGLIYHIAFNPPNWV